MKQVNLWNGRSYIVSDEKMEAIKREIAHGDPKTVVDTEDDQGNWFIISAVSGGGEVETEPYFMGNKMNKAMTRVLVDGDWKQFCGKPSDIEQRPALTKNQSLIRLNETKETL